MFASLSPPSAITWSYCFLTTSVSHIIVEESGVILLQFTEVYLCTAVVKSGHSISVGLRSELWLVQNLDSFVFAGSLMDEKFWYGWFNSVKVLRSCGCKTTLIITTLLRCLTVAMTCFCPNDMFCFGQTAMSMKVKQLHFGLICLDAAFGNLSYSGYVHFR